MTDIDILIVEDKETQIEEWKAAILQFNMFSKRNNTDLIFSAQFSKNYKDAKSKLRTFNFSTAIIDIRLEDESGCSNEDNTDGNEVLLDIVNSTMCLAWVYTGQQTDAEIPDHLVEYIDIIDRSAKSKAEVLEILESKLDTLKSIIEIKNNFSQSKASHFYSSIWPRWSLWSKETTGNTNKAIVRHMATHLHAFFLNETKEVHPEEYYFTGPMIHNKLDTGDIALVDGKHFILVTPRCEIAQEKNDFYQFVELEDKSEKMISYLNELAPLKEEAEKKKTDVKNIKKSLKALTEQLHAATKKKNIQKNTISQAISTIVNAEDGEMDKLNLKITGDVKELFKLEADEKEASKNISDKEIELTSAEAVSKKADKAAQLKDRDIKTLLPSSGGKISLHVLPEIKQLESATYGPLHAQFEKLTYISIDDDVAVGKFKSGKYARLSNEFIPSFVERLGSHFSRIGTPDYSHPE
jgi:hypothetical protein